VNVAIACDRNCAAERSKPVDFAEPIDNLNRAPGVLRRGRLKRPFQDGLRRTFVGGCPQHDPFGIEVRQGGRWPYRYQQVSRSTIERWPRNEQEAQGDEQFLRVGRVEFTARVSERRSTDRRLWAGGR